jgi:hypothetical protein
LPHFPCESSSMTHVHVLSISAITLILSIATVDGQPDPTRRS